MAHGLLVEWVRLEGGFGARDCFREALLGQIRRRQRELRGEVAVVESLTNRLGPGRLDGAGETAAVERDGGFEGGPALALGGRMVSSLDLYYSDAREALLKALGE